MNSFKTVRFQKGAGKPFLLYYFPETRIETDAELEGEVINMVILETKNLKKYYGEGESLVKALDGVDLQIEQGEFVSIVGTSGSGKSTLLHMLGGLDYPSEGQVLVDGKDISALKEDALAIFRRRKIGFVFQSYNLVPVLNVYENIVFPIQLDGNEVDRKYIDSIVKTLGLENKVNALPSQLSGGQQQRCAIARALIKNPGLLLCDEPTGALDSRSSREILILLEEINRKYKTTMLIVTHNNAVKDMVDQVVFLKDGQIKGNYRNGKKIPAAELEDL